MFKSLIIGGLVTKFCLTLLRSHELYVASQAALSMEFSRQEYWSRLLLPSPGDLPNPGIEPGSLTLAGRFFTTEPPGKLKERPIQLPDVLSNHFFFLIHL